MKKATAVLTAVILMLMLCFNAFASECEGGKHTYGEWKTVHEPTCTERGIESSKCLKCDSTRAREIPASGHKWGEWRTVIRPTCTEAGKRERTCSECGATESEEIAALGHKFGSETVTVQPACLTPGEKAGVCTACGKTVTEEIPPTGHKWGEWETLRESTCTRKGEKKHTCTVCSATETVETKLTPHKFLDLKIIEKATPYSPGKMKTRCEVCGELSERVIPCGAEDEKTHIRIETEPGTFEEDTELIVTEIDRSDDRYKQISKRLKTVSSDFVLYEIYALRGGERVQPKGSVKLTFAVPDGYGSSVEIYFISEDMKVKKPASSLINGDTEISCTLSELGMCAVSRIKDRTDPDVPTGGTPVIPIWAVIAAVLILAAAGYTVFFFIDRRKNNKQ